MGVLGKLKSIGEAIKDAPEEVVKIGGRMADNIRTEANTPGTSGYAFMNAPLGQYELPKLAQKVLGVVAPSPRTTIDTNRAAIQHPSFTNVVNAATTDVSLAALPALVSDGARLGRSPEPLKFPNPNPQRTMTARIKNNVMGAIERDKAATAEYAARQAELPGKIAAIKTELARLDQLGSRSAQALGGKTGNISKIADKLKGGEEGWIRSVDKPKTRTPSGIAVPAHTQIRFGEGKFPGEGALGEGPLQKGYYEAHLVGGSKPNAVKVPWLVKKGTPGNVSRPMEALTKGLKARGVDTIEHQPLTQSRSRLFARQLKKAGLKNADKHAPDIYRRDPNHREMAAGWGR